MTNGVWATPIRWVLIVAASAYAGHVAVLRGTPVDLALAFLCAVVAVVACASESSLLLGVPLLVLIEYAAVDEGQRLLAIGVVIAAVFAIGVVRRNETRVSAALIAIAAVLVLRWIPFSEVNLVRELLLIAFAIAIVEILHRTAFAIVVATITALITPAFPLRTFALPLAVLTIAALARFFGAPRLKLAWPSAIAIAFVMLFFPWSGIMARAFPYFVRPVVPAGAQLRLNYALAPNDSKRIDVPPEAKALIVSGANVARLRRGALLGHIQPGNIAVRIGDASDWGYMRRDHFFGAHNPLPRDVAGQIRGWGYTAWIDGAGRVALPANARTITVTADASLPADAALQVEAFELR
jgi:hypothetical protein